MARFLRKDGYVSNLGKVGKPVEESKEDALGSFSEYDVIIVGGGTAGCVLASRLSENTAIRVLLLESGKSSKNLLLSRIPAGFPLLLENKKKIYNFWTPPQEHTAGQRQYWPRARMLGGCSAINAQIYHCGDPADYNEWARLGGPGAESWAYKDIHKYFLKAEKFRPSSRHPDVELSSHNESGPMTVGFFSHHSRIADRFIEACSKLGIPRVSDLNTPKGSRGVAKLMTYVDDKNHRVTTETAYLSSDVLARPNLIVAVGATVTKLLSEVSKDAAEPRIVGVEFTRSKQGRKYRVRARKEVILSAGALHTPQIMMLSGLGPAVELAKHDIPVVIDLPGVGQHLMDHATVDVLYKDASGQSLIYLRPRNVREALRAVPHIVRYFVAGKGGLTTQVGEAAAFVRSDDAKLFPEALEGKLKDTTSGPDAPDLELFVSPFGYFEHGAAEIPSGDSLGLHVTMLRPTSTGTVTLKSKDPFDLPVIDPRYLSTEHDRAVLLRGLKFILRLATQSPLADIIDTAPRNVSPLWGHPLVMASDIELAEYVSKRLVTLYHPTSTARMGPRAEGGVVDPRLRVYGVQGLRVVDASIFPTIVSGHTAAPAIATAEKAADMIKEELESGAGQI